MRVKFSVGEIGFEGEFNNSKTAEAVYDKLPIEAVVDRWGEEIYFDTGLKLLNEHPTIRVRVGDIAYWPTGRAMCIFFGPTPMSKDQNPRPASEVTIIGRTDCRKDILENIKTGSAVKVEKA